MSTPMTTNLKLLGDTWSGCHLVQTYDWFINVFDELETLYMLCDEHLESVYG